MPIQSYLMMYFAGSGWQYGKRKISAMSNEQFNKLSPEELLKQHSIELKNMLPTLEKSLSDVTPLVAILIEQYGEFMKEILAKTPPVIQDVLVGEGTGIFSPTQPGNKALIQDFVNFFATIGNLFPSFPSAEGRVGSGGQHTTGTGKQEFTEAIVGPAIIKGHPMNEPHHQQPIKVLETPSQAIAPVQGGKKAAGQSQILERNRLILIIAAKAKEIKEGYIGLNLQSSPEKRAAAQKVINGIAVYMQARQQELVNLLDRYRF